MQTPLSLSPVIAGTMRWGQWGNKFDTGAYLNMITACLEAGVTSFDHADIYGHYTTEAEFGVALAEQPRLRSQLQLITKCGIRMVTPNRPEHRIKSYDTSKQHIISSAEQSLINLRTDYLDVLLLHRPDPLMHPQEVAEAFEQLKKSGKVLHFGVSNFSASQADLLLQFFPLITNQMELSILHLDPFLNGQLDQSLRHGIRPMAWSPLGGGQLFNEENTQEQQLRILAVARFLAEKYQRQPEQILLSWLMTHPAGIIPVLGTAQAKRIREAQQAADLKLSREEWFMLWRASTGHEVP